MITREFEARVKKARGTKIDVPVHVTLSYDADVDPFTVQAIFGGPGLEQERVWSFSRELLLGGLNSPTPFGPGDVKFRYPGGGILLVCLNNRTGHSDIAFPHEEVADFLEETTDAALHGIQAIEDLTDEFLKELFEA